MKLDHQAPTEDVERIRVRLLRARMSVTQVAEELGITRTSLSLMLNGTSPMRRAYALAILYLLDQKGEVL